MNPCYVKAGSHLQILNLQGFAAGNFGCPKGLLAQVPTPCTCQTMLAEHYTSNTCGLTSGAKPSTWSFSVFNTSSVMNMGK